MDDLLDIDVLVFSSHKTGTQTITHSLQSSGMRAVHCHLPIHIGLEPNAFSAYLRKYRQTHGRSLTTISVFRDPMERMISSFFQSLSEHPDAWTTSDDDPVRPGDTEVYDRPFHVMEALFQSYCRPGLDPWAESLSILCSEVGIRIGDLRFSPDECLGINELMNCRLCLSRFDCMTSDLKRILDLITGLDVHIQTANVSNTKPYHDRYTEFRTKARVPSELIRRLYYSRRELMDLFYPDQFDMILTERIRRYSHHVSGRAL